MIYKIEIKKIIYKAVLGSQPLNYLTVFSYNSVNKWSKYFFSIHVILWLE